MIGCPFALPVLCALRACVPADRAFLALVAVHTAPRGRWLAHMPLAGAAAGLHAPAPSACAGAGGGKGRACVGGRAAGPGPGPAVDSRRSNPAIPACTHRPRPGPGPSLTGCAGMPYKNLLTPVTGSPVLDPECRFRQAQSGALRPSYSKRPASRILARSRPLPGRCWPGTWMGYCSLYGV